MHRIIPTRYMYQHDQHLELYHMSFCAWGCRGRDRMVVAAGKPAIQESSLDVFCHVIFDVNIDVMDVRGRPQEFVAL